MLATVAGLTATLHAQSESASIRLLAFSRVGDAREVKVVGPDGKPLYDKPLALPTEQLSAPQTVASRSLVFLPASASATGEAKPSEGSNTPAPAGSAPAVPPLGKVELPATGKDFILVFLPEAAGAAQPYRVDAVPVPEGSFGSGDQAFVNYSGSNVGFVIGGEKLQVPQGKSAIYHPQKTEGKRSIVGYAQEKDGKWNATPFYSSRLIVQEGVRNFILIVRDPKTGTPDFRGIADFVEKPAASSP